MYFRGLCVALALVLLSGCGGGDDAGYVYPRVDYAPAAHTGGSNFNWYEGACAKTESDVNLWWAEFNTIKHMDEARTINQLAAMYAAGQRALRLSIFWYGDTVTTNGTGSAVVAEADGTLPDWYVANYIRTIEIAQSLGFEQFTIASHPVGNRRAHYWEAAWNGELLTWLDDLIGQLPPGTEFYVDLVNEAMQEERNREPLRALWNEAVAYEWASERAFIGSMFDRQQEGRAIANAAFVYQDHPPAVLGVNYYSDESDFGEAIRRLKDAVADVPVVVGESYFNSEVMSSRTAYQLAEAGEQILYLTQWPLSYERSCLPHVDTLPVIDFDNWLEAGF